jgi:hypothetical protein
MANKLAPRTAPVVVPPKPAPAPAKPSVFEQFKADGKRVLRAVLENPTEAKIVGGYDGQILPIYIKQDSVGGHSLAIENAVGLAPVNLAAKSQTAYLVCFDQLNNNWMSIT